MGDFRGPIIGPPLCRDTPVSRTAVILIAVVFCSSVQRYIIIIVCADIYVYIHMIYICIYYAHISIFVQIKFGDSVQEHDILIKYTLLIFPFE